MPAKYEGWCLLRDQQQKYHRTIIRLHNLNCDACLELRKIGPSNSTNKRYQDAGVFFSAVAAQMTSGLQFLVEIPHSAQQPSCPPVEFVYSPVCGKCTASPYEREDHVGVGIPPLDPANYAELEELLELVNHTSERLWSSRKGRKTLPAALTTGLKSLANVLVKLLRHFREAAPVMPPRLESHQHDGDDCSRCHGPLTIPAGERPAGVKNEIK